MANSPKQTYGTGFAIITLLLASVLFYLYVEDYFSTQHNPNQRISTTANAPLRLKMSGDGHYRVSGLINDEPVVFMLDTGATSIALSDSLARRLNLDKLASVESMTANGLTTGWLTTLDSITIGGITITDMSAVILPNMDDEILLGMSYLRHFDWQHSQGELILNPVL